MYLQGFICFAYFNLYLNLINKCYELSLERRRLSLREIKVLAQDHTATELRFAVRLAGSLSHASTKLPFFGALFQSHRTTEPHGLPVGITPSCTSSFSKPFPEAFYTPMHYSKMSPITQTQSCQIK